MNTFAETNRLYDARNYAQLAGFVKYLDNRDMADHWMRFQRDYASAALDVMRGGVWGARRAVTAVEPTPAEMMRHVSMSEEEMFALMEVAGNITAFGECGHPAVFGETGQLDLAGAWHPPVKAADADRVGVGTFLAWNASLDAATPYTPGHNYVYYAVDAIDDTPVGQYALLRTAGMGLEANRNYDRQKAALPATRYIPVGDLADWPTFEEVSAEEGRIEAAAMAAEELLMAGVQTLD